MRKKTTCFRIAVNICMLSAGICWNMLFFHWLWCPAITLSFPCSTCHTIRWGSFFGCKTRSHELIHTLSSYSFKTQLPKHEPWAQFSSLCKTSMSFVPCWNPEWSSRYLFQTCLHTVSSAFERSQTSQLIWVLYRYTLYLPLLQKNPVWMKWKDTVNTIGRANPEEGVFIRNQGCLYTQQEHPIYHFQYLNQKLTSLHCSKHLEVCICTGLVSPKLPSYFDVPGYIICI